MGYNLLDVARQHKIRVENRGVVKEEDRTGMKLLVT